MDISIYTFLGLIVIIVVAVFVEVSDAPDDEEMAAIKERDGIPSKIEKAEGLDYAKIDRLERELGIGDHALPEASPEPVLDDAARRARSLGMEVPPPVTHPSRSSMGCRCDSCRVGKTHD